MTAILVYVGFTALLILGVFYLRSTSFVAFFSYLSFKEEIIAVGSSASLVQQAFCIVLFVGFVAAVTLDIMYPPKELRAKLKKKKKASI